MCRSPIAAAIGNKFYSNKFLFDSAGISSEGLSAAKNAKDVLKKLFEIDISNHRTKNVNYMNLNEFHKIIALDKDVFANLLKHISPEYLILLDINDPYTYPYHAYEICARDIENKLNQLFVSWDTYEVNS
jgi:ribose 5-phosphate isomerase B